MIPKAPTRTPSNAPVIAVETGSGMSTERRRTTSQARVTIVSRPSTTPAKPRQPVKESSMSTPIASETPKSCHGKKRR